MPDRRDVIAFVVFPFVALACVYAIAAAAASRRKQDGFFQMADEDVQDRWTASVMPYTPLASNADDLSPSAWSSLMTALSSTPDALAERRKWTPLPDKREAVLTSGLRDVANAVGSGWTARRVKVDGAYFDANQPSTLAWDVMACFGKAAGAARGWCARLRMLADVSDADPNKWAFYVASASPSGVVTESALLLMPGVEGGGAKNRGAAANV